jgi:uroporphyrinogen decarboxylase
MDIQPIRDKWRGTMSDRERFTRQMKRDPVDRCFNMEFGYWQENFRTWPGFIENGIKTNAEADIFFNFDRIATVSGCIWMHPEFEETVVSETDDKKIIINPDGLYAEIPKDGHSTIPHFTKSSVNTPEDWKKIKAERFSLDHPDRSLDIGAIKKRHPENRDYPLGVNCGSMIGKIRDMLTMEGLAYACYDYPDMVEDMVETSCLLVEQSLDQLLPHFDFDFASGWEDICFKNGPLVSVDFFNSVVVPRYTRIRKKLDAYGIDLWYSDCDGDIRPLIPGFLEGGINCMFPFEVMGSGHPGDILKEYGSDITILGGFDKTKMIAGRESIRSYMESLLPFVEDGGFIPFCDHRCPPDVAWEDYLYYLDLKEEMFGIK